jgi:hypothetical protein
MSEIGEGEMIDVFQDRNVQNTGVSESGTFTINTPCNLLSLF